VRKRIEQPYGLAKTIGGLRSWGWWDSPPGADGSPGCSAAYNLIRLEWWEPSPT